MITNRFTFSQFRATAGRKGALVLFLVVLCALALGAPLRGQNATIITFDAPGAGTGAGQGTLAWSITPETAIAGYYLDSSYVYHGFLRSRDGDIITFDAPGAGTGAGQGTLASNINSEGIIAGFYVDASNVYHGFVRTGHGTFTTFDVPGAGTGSGQGTFTCFVACINPQGAIDGSYIDASNVNHGYVRAPDGTITTYLVPGAGAEPFQGVFALGINPAGTIPGVYADVSNVVHSYVRSRDGDIITFDVPGAGTGAGAPGCFTAASCQGTYVENINAGGRSWATT